jgi:hypothetical protein
MRDILLVGVAGYIGWYLALNEKEATLNALKQAKAEALKLKEKLEEEIKTNENLNTLLDGISIRQGFDGGKTKDLPINRKDFVKRPKLGQRPIRR